MNCMSLTFNAKIRFTKLNAVAHTPSPKKYENRRDSHNDLVRNEWDNPANIHANKFDVIATEIISA